MRLFEKTPPWGRKSPPAPGKQIYRIKRAVPKSKRLNPCIEAVSGGQEVLSLPFGRVLFADKECQNKPPKVFLIVISFVI